MYINKQTEIWSRSELNGGELKGNIIVSDNNLEKVRKNKISYINWSGARLLNSIKRVCWNTE